MRCSIAGVLIPLLVASAADADVRTWIGSKGQYTTEAELVEVKQDSIRLRKSNQRLVWVPLARLSQADRGYVKVWKAHHGQAEARGKQAMTVETYAVKELVSAGNTDDLHELCTTIIAPDSWDEVGGPGSLSFAGGKMTVRQSSEVQQDIASLLAGLGNLPRFRAPLRAAPRTTQIHVGQNPNVGGTPLQIVVYPVADLLSRRAVNFVDFDALIEHLITTVEPTGWEEVGGPASAREYADRGVLVISNTKQAHAQIIKVLAELRKRGARGSR